MTNLLKTIPLIWKFPKNNIFECMVLHYFFLKVNGYACFTIAGELESGKIRTTILDRILFSFYFLLALLLWISSVWFVEGPSNMSPLLAIGNKMIWLTCYFSALFGIVWNFFNRNRVWSLYTSVFNVDQQLLSLGAKMYYTETYLIMIGFSICSMVFLAILVVGYFMEVGFNWLAFITFSYSNISLTMLTTIFVIAGSLIILRLWALNRLIENGIVLSEKTRIIQVVNKDCVRTVQQYMQIYDQLCDLTETVNFCYSGQVMIAVAGSFVYLLFFAFGLVMFIKRKDPLSEFPVSLLVWSWFYVCNTMSTVVVGSFLSHQGKYTSNLIDQAINSTNNAEIIEMLRLFLMQLGHRSPTLTCGLFPFDWTLVYSILATSTTYLIILIQFENSRSV